MTHSKESGTMHKTSRRRGIRRHAGVLAAALAAAFAAPAPAFEFESAGGAVTGYFDTTISLGALWRMQGRDSSLIAITNGGTSRDPNADDGNLNYKKGALVSLAAKATSDLLVKYGNFGAFARATYYYDWAAARKDGVPATTEYDFKDQEVDLLDLYAYGKFDVFGRGLFVRAGNQVVSWGESTFIQNGINILNPVNVSKLRVPGSELKEALTPTPMLWAMQELTDDLSVEATWMVKWKKTKIDGRGVYFSTNDFVGTDGIIAYTGFGRRNDQHNPAGIFPAPPNYQLFAPRSDDRDPSDGGQYGIALRYLLPEYNNTELGLYFVNYHSRTPYVSGYRGGATAAQTISTNLPPSVLPAFAAAGIPVFPGNPACTVIDAFTLGALSSSANVAKLVQVGLPPAAAAGLAGLNGTNGGCAVANGRAGTYFVEYPEDIKLWGLSVNTAGPAGIALQGEYSYRSNQPLQLPSAELLLAALGQGNQLTSTNPLVAGAVPYGTEISGYRRVKMHQLQATATKAFGPTFNANQLVTVAEVGYTHLDLPDLKFAGPGCHLPQPGSSTSTSFGSTSTDCFTTKNSWGYRIVGRLDYDGVVDGGTLSPRIAFAHDVDGVGPTFNEGAKALTVGLGFVYLQKWQADIGYTMFFGGNTFSGIDPSPVPTGQSASYASGSNYLKDRDFLSINISYSF